VSVQCEGRLTSIGDGYLAVYRLYELTIWLFGTVGGMYLVVCRPCELAIMALCYGGSCVFGGL